MTHPTHYRLPEDLHRRPHCGARGLPRTTPHPERVTCGTCILLVAAADVSQAITATKHASAGEARP
jgi:hypothetical protein